MRLTLDSSFIVKVFLNERWSKQAKQILDTPPARELDLTASELALFEVGNAICKRDTISSSKRMEYIRQLYDLNIEYMSLNPATSLEAMDIAIDKSISYYDAVHVAVTAQQGSLLVTEDRTLLKRCESAVRIKDALDLINE